MRLRILDMFSGIGGFSLGLERADPAFQTVRFVEKEPFCQAVLRKHWPDVPCDDDVTTAEFTEGEADVITGGFPCQDLSNAGGRAGLSGARSGLYRELVRAFRVVRPRVMLVENVAALLGRGLGVVLGDLAESGACIEWDCVPASAVRAPHIRDRIWIVAHSQHPDPDRIGPHRAREHDGSAEFRDEQGGEPGSVRATLADADINAGFTRRPCEPSESSEGRGVDRGIVGSDAAKSRSERLSGAKQTSLRGAGRGQERRATEQCRGALAIPDSFAAVRAAVARGECDPWEPEPDVGRVANGVPARVDRIKALGGSLVPQIPELIGRAIVSQMR